MRRGNIEMMLDILECCNTPQRLTHVALKCHLNSIKAKELLERLKRDGRIKLLQDKFYKTTKEGQKVVQTVSF